MPACSGDASRSAVRRTIPRARHQRLDRSPSRHRPPQRRRRRDRDLLVEGSRVLRGRRRPRPTAFVEGVPRGATRLDLIARPGAGFVPEAGRLGRRTPLSISRDRQLLPRRTWRGRHPAGGARPRGVALHGSVGGRCGTRHGQARVRRNDDGGRHRRIASRRRSRPMGRLPGSTARTSSSPASAARASASRSPTIRPRPRPSSGPRPTTAPER